ncbi:MAG: RlfA protein [Flavobacterium sp. BFFFF2]|nr:MAG: RlfA protein [Flavobacterium sp. BFFFF2]
MKTFNFYCDESCHLENDGMPYMVISYVSCAFNQVKLHQQNIKILKEKHSFKNEIKWSSISKSKYNFYVELIEYFFANDLQYRAIVVPKHKIKNNDFDQDFDDFYYKMYYQLLNHKMNMENKYNIYLDIKDTLSANKVQKLKKILNIKYSSIENLQNIHSKESLLMQLTDVLMGAITYHLRGLNKVTAKTKLIEKIQKHTQLPLNISTSKNFEKFNLFFIDLK